MGEYIADNFKREAMNPAPARASDVGLDLYRARTSPSTTWPPCRPTSASPATRPRAGSPSPNTCAASASTVTPRSPPCSTPPLHRPGGDIYGYQNFVCDTSGSICEVVEADDPNDPVMTELSQHLLLVWIKGSEAHRAELTRRFEHAPKPMYYRPDFLAELWAEYSPTATPLPRSIPTPSCALACPPAGQAPAALCRDGPLGRHRHRRRGRRRPRPRRL